MNDISTSNYRCVVNNKLNMSINASRQSNLYINKSSNGCLKNKSLTCLFHSILTTRTVTTSTNEKMKKYMEWLIAVASRCVSM